MKKICFAVNNNLAFDQRMLKIGKSLDKAGYHIYMIGRQSKYFNKNQSYPFQVEHINTIFKKGKLLYIEFNLRLLLRLLFTRFDSICAVDLDTSVPCFIAGSLKRKPIVMDAHELFSELYEVVSRPFIHKAWHSLESWIIPKYKNGYTVNTFIRDEFKKRYNADYHIVRNLPEQSILEYNTNQKEDFILCQGAVNFGRGWDILVQAIKQMNIKCVVAGDGNYFNKLIELIDYHNAKDNFKLTGMLEPEELKTLTRKAKIGVTLFENTGLNQFQSLSNRFFDYMMAGTPQVCVGYPCYLEILNKFPFAEPIKELTVHELVTALNKVMNDDVKYQDLQEACKIASEVLNWENESQILIEFWNQILPQKLG